jgi:hypothetical protein
MSGTSQILTENATFPHRYVQRHQGIVQVTPHNVLPSLPHHYTGLIYFLIIILQKLNQRDT